MRFFSGSARRLTLTGDDERTRAAILVRSHPDRPIPDVSILHACFPTCRAVLCEVSMMIRLSPDAARMPIYPRNMTEEDRQTYRRWARGWYISTATVLVALLAV